MVPPSQSTPTAPDALAVEPSVNPSSPLTGTVLAVQANYYFVQLDVTPSNVTNINTQSIQLSTSSQSLLCTRRTRLKKIGQTVHVGDRVQIEEPDWQGGRGAISHVFPRHSELDRPPIANADQILLVFALAEPTLDPIQLSRFLVKAESTGLSIALCLNKCDLVSEADQQTWCDRLQSWGYPAIAISVEQKINLDALYEQLDQKTTLVSGPSGVGKSSLINHLIPDIDLRTGEVSGKLGRGRHTTRHVELFQLPTGGLLADSPGFNQPDLDCTAVALGQYFPEVRSRLIENQCQFSNCLHREEPNCVVQGDWERYAYYQVFLAEAIAYQEAQQQSKTAEATTKVKMGGDGVERTEPKLMTKRYRNPSRRTEKQSLRSICEDVTALMEDED
jgi:ribosome biogenesis GTPase / thiamine phosphate phosphatase